jgi:hypothetical protein
MAMLRAYIEHSDFGRSMRMVVLRDSFGEPAPGQFTGKYDGRAVVPTGGGHFELRPIEEGERISDAHTFIRLPEGMAQEFFQSLVVALAQSGYIQPDRSGTELKEARQHLETLKEENSRLHGIVNKLLGRETSVQPMTLSAPISADDEGVKALARIAERLTNHVTKGRLE